MGPDPPLPFSPAGHLQHGLGVRQEGGTASPLVAQSLSPDSRLHRAPVSGLTGGREQCAASPRLWYLGLLLCPRTTWSGCWQRQPGLVAWPPNFLSFQFQLKIETARTHLVLSDSVGGAPVQTQAPHFWARDTQPPVSPTHAPAAHSLPLLGQLLLRLCFLREHLGGSRVGERQRQGHRMQTKT